MNMNESVTEVLRFFLPSFFLPLLALLELGWVVVMEGSFSGTDSGTSASPPSYLSSLFL